MFRITMLPAAQGDCLWIEYGTSTAPHRILIDGGVHASGAALRTRIESLPADARVFELAVITHVDLDHIAGMLDLLDDPPDGFVVKDFWFNGFNHLPESKDDTSTLGARMGEILMERLQRERATLKDWNGAFHGKAVSVGSMALPDSAAGLPTVTLAGGMQITVLGPTGESLQRLRPKWVDEIEKLGLEAGHAGGELLGHPEDEVDDESVLGDDRLDNAHDVKKLAAAVFREDASLANGSSIVLLAEYEGKRCLFAGDSFAKNTLAAIELLARGDETFKVDAWKLAHHGGEKNTSPGLIAAIDTGTYLVSTSGIRYRHPKAATLSRILVHRPTATPARFVFNYRSAQTSPWADASKFAPDFLYEAVFPKNDGVNVVEL